MAHPPNMAAARLHLRPIDALRQPQVAPPLWHRPRTAAAATRTAATTAAAATAAAVATASAAARALPLSLLACSAVRPVGPLERVLEGASVGVERFAARL
eukprot:2844968-Prymnesium_polylepis.1